MSKTKFLLISAAFLILFTFVLPKSLQATFLRCDPNCGSQCGWRDESGCRTGAVSPGQWCCYRKCDNCTCRTVAADRGPDSRNQCPASNEGQNCCVPKTPVLTCQTSNGSSCSCTSDTTPTWIWTQETPPPVGNYKIFRSWDTTTVLCKDSPDTCNFTNKTFTPTAKTQGTWGLQVAATNGVGTSVKSNLVTATIDTSAPTVVNDLLTYSSQCDSQGNKTLTFSWNASTASGCLPTAYWVQISSTSATLKDNGEFVDPNIKNGWVNTNSYPFDATPFVVYYAHVLAADMEFVGQTSTPSYPHKSRWSVVSRSPIPINECVPPSTSVSPPVDTNCVCQTESSSTPSCSTNCSFEKHADLTYVTPLGCRLPDNLFVIPPSTAQINGWCQASRRSKGDADGNGIVNNTDYFYYLRAVVGGKIPPTVNPDFNGDNEVGSNDRAIIIKTLNSAN